jgi:hypothetical protein
VALALRERHVLQAAAHAYFGMRVARLDHFGSYACRNMYGRTDAALSRHATADAVDIAGFALANGDRIRVINDWVSPIPRAFSCARYATAPAVYSTACSVPNTTLPTATTFTSIAAGGVSVARRRPAVQRGP